jgi:hypothetical protein
MIRMKTIVIKKNVKTINVFIVLWKRNVLDESIHIGIIEIVHFRIDIIEFFFA